MWKKLNCGAILVSNILLFSALGYRLIEASGVGIENIKSQAIAKIVTSENVGELGKLEEDFGKDDLVDLVKELEREADDGGGITSSTQSVELESGGSSDKDVHFQTINKISGFVVDKDAGRNSSGSGDVSGSGMGPIRSKEDQGDRIQGKEADDYDDSGFLEMLPKDLSDLNEDIVEDITAGVEESLRIFGGNASEAETRQMPMYMFQGHYVAEPRLNRFIDGALRNMGTEVRLSSMDPIYFRVLPKGRVVLRGQPVQVKKVIKQKVRRRRPVGRRRRATKTQSLKTSIVESTGRIFGFRRKQQIQKQRQKLRAQRIKARKRRQRQRQRQRIKKQNQKLSQNLDQDFQDLQVQENKQTKLNKQNKQNVRNVKKGKSRQRRQNVKQNVGGGRVEGLSKVTRDGDAEMQLFGNYTLIRSHMKIGPVELTMQFRTKKGIRRTGATLPVMRAHTVTRVNHEGSEMVDFLLDRPHPETIKVRGNLFPMAQKIARNIFSRLFLPDSFLVQKVREKTGLALLSKPTIGSDFK